MTDWFQWHRHYADPESQFSQRLAVVHREVAGVLDGARLGTIRVVDVCAGQGFAIFPVLVGHPRGPDVHTTLVELDPANCAAARAEADRLGLAHVRVVEGDAGASSTYEGIDRADLVIVSGVFRHLCRRDLRRTLRGLRQILGPGGLLVWTTSNQAHWWCVALTRWDVRRSGFDLVAFTQLPNTQAVGLSRMRHGPYPFVPGVRWFSFLSAWRPPWWRRLLSPAKQRLRRLVPGRAAP